MKICRLRSVLKVKAAVFFVKKHVASWISTTALSQHYLAWIFGCCSPCFCEHDFFDSDTKDNLKHGHQVRDCGFALIPRTNPGSKLPGQLHHEDYTDIYLPGQTKALYCFVSTSTRIIYCLISSDLLAPIPSYYHRPLGPPSNSLNQDKLACDCVQCSRQASHSPIKSTYLSE